MGTRPKSISLKGDRRTMINAVCEHHLRASLCMLIRSQYIKNDLTAKFSLVLGIKDKATCSVAELFSPPFPLVPRCRPWAPSGSGCISDAVANYIHLIATRCN